MVIKLKRLAVGIFVFIFGVLLIIFSDSVRQGVQNGIALCLNTVIPSLFLFTTLALILIKSGLAKGLGNLIEPFSSAVFGLTGEQFAVMLTSFVSGYPVGAGLISELFKTNRITKRKATMMLSFCVSAGPGFIVVTVGEAMLGSRNDGYRLFIAHTVSALIIAIISRFFYKKDAAVKSIQKAPVEPHSLSEMFTDSVYSAAKSMLSVSAFIVVFSGLGSIFAVALKTFPLFSKIFRACLEVTAGIGFFGRKQLPIIAFFLGFGGISVHFQVLSNAKAINCPYSFLFLSRIIHGLLSLSFCLLMELISPRVLSTGATSELPTVGLHGSPVSGAALLFMGMVLIYFCSNSQTKKG